MNTLFAGMAAIIFAATSCGPIDEDLSDCGADVAVEYRLRLVAEMDDEIDSKLTTPEERIVAEQLRTALGNVFSEHAHDIALSFFTSDSLVALSESHIMDAAQSHYSLYLPLAEYMHLALANTELCGNVSTEGAGRAPDMQLVQTLPTAARAAAADTVANHAAGLFTARRRMNITDRQAGPYLVTLYMANSAAALVVDTTGHDVGYIRVTAEGFAGSFAVRDSLYRPSARPYVVRSASTAIPPAARRTCNYMVCFPSAADVWTIKAYVPLADGTVTENVLTVPRPLRAGRLMIIKMKLADKGVLVPDTGEGIGVSVTLDWQEGGTYNPEL